MAMVRNTTLLNVTIQQSIYDDIFLKIKRIDEDNIRSFYVFYLTQCATAEARISKMKRDCCVTIMSKEMRRLMETLRDFPWSNERTYNYLLCTVTTSGSEVTIVDDETNLQLNLKRDALYKMVVNICYSVK